MTRTNRKNTIEMDRIIRSNFGAPRGKQLPQVATQEEVIIDLIHECTGLSHTHLNAQMAGRL